MKLCSVILIITAMSLQTLCDEDEVSKVVKDVFSLIDLFVHTSIENPGVQATGPYIVRNQGKIIELLGSKKLREVLRAIPGKQHIMIDTDYFYTASLILVMVHIGAAIVITPENPVKPTFSPFLTNKVFLEDFEKVKADLSRAVQALTLNTTEENKKRFNDEYTQFDSKLAELKQTPDYIQLNTVLKTADLDIDMFMPLIKDSLFIFDIHGLQLDPKNLTPLAELIEDPFGKLLVV